MRLGGERNEKKHARRLGRAMKERVPPRPRQMGIIAVSKGLYLEPISVCSDRSHIGVAEDKEGGLKQRTACDCVSQSCRAEIRLRRCRGQGRVAPVGFDDLDGRLWVKFRVANSCYGYAGIGQEGGWRIWASRWM